MVFLVRGGFKLISAMKRIAYVIVMILLAPAASLVNAQTRELGGAGELLDGVAALVDEGVVLKSELRNRVRTVAENFALSQANLPPEERVDLPPLSILEQQVLDQLILEEIQVQRASRVGIEIGDDLLNTVLVGIADAIGVTLAELPGWLESQGVDYAQFRQDQRRDVMIRELERAEIMRSAIRNRHSASNRAAPTR